VRVADFLDELEPEHLAMLELYRDDLAPTPEIEDRVLARIQAQAAIEVERRGAGIDPPVGEMEHSEPHVRAWTHLLVAAAAFAAGAALTWWWMVVSTGGPAAYG
jgi:hypothetical protein